MAKRATDWDKHDNTGVEPADVHPPRTDEETDSSIESRLKRYRAQFLVGYMILLLGLLAAFTVNNYDTCQSRQANVGQINDTIGGILTRLDTANQLQYEKGNVTFAEREMARQFYQGELDQLPIAVKCSIL